MSCSTSSCGCGSNKKVLEEANLEKQIIEVVSGLKKGDEVVLACKKDFTQDLVTIMNANFPNSKIKAVVLDSNSSETIIQMKYPESEESCCGFCS